MYINHKGPCLNPNPSRDGAHASNLGFRDAEVSAAQELMLLDDALSLLDPAEAEAMLDASVCFHGIGESLQSKGASSSSFALPSTLVLGGSTPTSTQQCASTTGFVVCLRWGLRYRTG